MIEEIFKIWFSLFLKCVPALYTEGQTQPPKTMLATFNNLGQPTAPLPLNPNRNVTNVTTCKPKTF